MSEKILLNDRDVTAQAIRRRMQGAFLKKQRRTDLGKALFLVVFICFMFRFIFGFSLVYGDTMEPALYSGDLLLYYRLQSGYESGDVVVYEVNSVTHVGRIAAVPGEDVTITEDGQLVINGYTQTNFSDEEAYAAGVTEYPAELGDDEYFIMADDHTSASDSRNYGPISEKDIKGLVITLLRRRNI